MAYYCRPDEVPKTLLQRMHDEEYIKACLRGDPKCDHNIPKQFFCWRCCEDQPDDIE